jgi:hypothetical protein
MLPMSDEKPPEKPTITMKAVRAPGEEPEPEGALDKILVRLDGLHRKVDAVAGVQADFIDRLVQVEDDMKAVQKRQNDGSLRVRQESGVNLQQDAVIGEMKTDLHSLKIDVQALHVKTDIQTSMMSKAEKAAAALWNNKAVQGAVIGLIVAAATAGTAYFTHLTQGPP